MPYKNNFSHNFSTTAIASTGLKSDQTTATTKNPILQKPTNGTKESKPITPPPQTKMNKGWYLAQLDFLEDCNEISRTNTYKIHKAELKNSLANPIVDGIFTYKHFSKCFFLLNDYTKS